MTAPVEQRPSSYLPIEDMVWPHPGDPGDIEWQLRYGDPEAVRYIAASYVAAYRELVGLPRRTRELRIAQIRAAAKERDV